MRSSAAFAFLRMPSQYSRRSAAAASASPAPATALRGLGATGAMPPEVGTPGDGDFLPSAGVGW